MFNNSTVTLLFKQRLDIFEIISYSILSSILIIITIAGNILVIVGFCYRKSLQSLSNYFLISLAVSDLLIGIVSMPFYTTFLILDKWPFSTTICNIWLTVDYTASNASVANLFIISLDRYLSVKSPISYRIKRTNKKVIKWIVFAWLISAVIWVPLINIIPIIFKNHPIPQGECYVQFLFFLPSLTVLISILVYFLPTTIIAILYLQIYQTTQTRNLSKIDFNKSDIQICRKSKPWQRITCQSTENLNKINHKEYSRSISLASLFQRPSIIKFSHRRFSKDSFHYLRTNIKFPKNSSTSHERNSDKENVSITFLQDEKHMRSQGINSISQSFASDINEIEYQRKFHKPSIISNKSESYSVILLNNSVHQKRINKPDRKAAKILSAILLVFIITWSPYNIFTIINAFYSSSQKPIGKILYNLGYWLCYINSTVNPILYALCNKIFRQTFIHLLTCCKRK